MNSLLARLRKSSHAHSEFDDEMRFHLEMQVQEDRSNREVDR